MRPVPRGDRDLDGGVVAARPGQDGDADVGPRLGADPLRVALQGALGRRSALTLKEFLSARHVLISSMGSGHQQLERALAEHGVEENVALRVPHFIVVPLIAGYTVLSYWIFRGKASAGLYDH